MKNIFITIGLFFLSYLFIHAQQSHVVVISVDGFRPEFYKDPSWGMVHLRQAMTEGAYSDGVRGVFPSVTYPSHTTIVTGVKPIKHGIYYNTPLEPEGATGRWYWEYDSLKVPTLWSAAKDAGLTTACVMWPVTVKAPITWRIPEYWFLPQEKGAPKDVVGGMSKEAHPAGLYEEIRDNVNGKMAADYFTSDVNNARMTAYLIRRYKPSFTAVHIADVDHAEHEQGRDGEQVRSAVASADQAIKTIVDAVEKAGIKENTTIIVTGDHGFVDIHTQLNPNVLLAKSGLIDPKNKTHWKAFFHSSGGSSFLHLKDKNDTATLEKVKEILNSTPSGLGKLFQIVDRSGLDSIGSDPNASLALAPIQGVTFGNDVNGELLSAVKGGTHGYFPNFKEIETGFVVFGKGIRKGVVVNQMGLEDIAPLIAKLLGINFPSADGLLYPGLLQK
ncbi:alkaline phosphatase family protein [Olivibacter sp. SDN3]|uniref:alkaline phosphatase family protein n=1 Tax=Olivibacter sp. SDN3 TaxID=2764720 RepID=UPI0016518921|nr:ectonucleotide pyrophosphatase/phosphodiesterase [Olivibacter sp. SDN3]QNL48019.1 alkaline phosphatase family protein [Olivibacter sp. SDN3]